MDPGNKSHPMLFGALVSRSDTIPNRSEQRFARAPGAISAVALTLLGFVVVSLLVAAFG